MIDISNGAASSQSGFFYSHLIDNTMSSIHHFDEGNYVISIDLKYELEWDFDMLTLFASCHSCDNDILEVFSGHHWNEFNKLIPFQVLDNNTKALNLNISTDSDLHYRGFEINNINILYKPEYECVVGDVSLDGYINVVDIIEIINIIMSDDYTAFQACSSDMNDDEIINVSDITLIVEIITGD